MLWSSADVTTVSVPEAVTRSYTKVLVCFVVLKLVVNVEVVSVARVVAVARDVCVCDVVFLLVE